MDKADTDDSTRAADARPTYVTATEAITLLAFGEAITLEALNAEREGFVAARIKARAEQKIVPAFEHDWQGRTFREEWAECGGRGALMAAAAALLMHELRGARIEVRGTLDGDPAGLWLIVTVGFLLLPITINNDAFEADPAASMRDFTRARQLPDGGTRPMYRDLRFKTTDVLGLGRKLPKAAPPAKKPRVPWADSLRLWAGYLAQHPDPDKRPNAKEQRAGFAAHVAAHRTGYAPPSIEDMKRLRAHRMTPEEWSERGRRPNSK